MRGDRLLGPRDLGRRHLREVLALEHLAIRHGEPGIDLDLALAFLQLVLEAGEQRLLDARGAGLRLVAAWSRACGSIIAMSWSR